MSERIRPTPETLTKAKPDVVWQLESDGYLRREHSQAAHEIDDAYRALTSDTAWSLMNFEGVGRELRNPHFIRHTSEWVDILIERYNAWVDELTHRKLGPVVGPVLDIVVFDQTIRAVARSRGFPRFLVPHVLRTGLQIYAEKQGWVKPETWELGDGYPSETG